MHRFRRRSVGKILQSEESLSLSLAQSSSSRAGHLVNATTDPDYYYHVDDGCPMAQADDNNNSSSPTADGIITSTCFDIPGYRIERAMGTVYGLSIRSRGSLPVVGASLETLAGGDVGAVTKLMCRTRDDAVARLAAECRRRRGANAVVGLRLDTSQLAGGMAQVCAYGTAVYAVRVDGGARNGGGGDGGDDDDDDSAARAQQWRQAGAGMAPVVELAAEDKDRGSVCPRCA